MPDAPRALLLDVDLDRIAAWAAIIAVDGEWVTPPTPHAWRDGEPYWDAARWNDWRAQVGALVAEVRAARAGRS